MHKQYSGKNPCSVTQETGVRFPVMELVVVSTCMFTQLNAHVTLNILELDHYHAYMITIVMTVMRMLSCIVLH